MNKPRPWLYWAVLSVLCLLGVSCCKQQQKDPFRYKVAIIGNPSNPDIRYDESQMQALKDLGYNTLQLNIAWGARPADEPLNLEDILYVDGIGSREKADQRLQAIKERARIAKKWGFRTLFHFGAPRVDSLYKILTPDLIDIATEKNSIQKKEIVDKYVSLLKRLKQEVPELDDIEVYTFDQDAWVANEFGNGPTDRDIPLHERIPAFLQALTGTWAEVSPDGMVWWEPWEISAGQIYACIPSLPTRNFGMFLHSNIAEVQLSRPVDVWFKNTVQLCAERGIPVVGEIFMASANEELQPLTHIAAPRLVAEELDAVGNVPNIQGVKEYFGLTPDRYDPNQLMAGIKLHNLAVPNEQALAELAEPFGTAAADVLSAWEASATGLAVFPWDATWRFRLLTENPAGIEVYHRWDIAHIEGAVAPSPSWKSTRRSLFMTTESESPVVLRRYRTALCDEFRKIAGGGRSLPESATAGERRTLRRLFGGKYKGYRRARTDNYRYPVLLPRSESGSPDAQACRRRESYSAGFDRSFRGDYAGGYRQSGERVRRKPVGQYAGRGNARTFPERPGRMGYG